MTIEFRCQQCGKLLRTADETAGRQAKCPACSTVLQVPPASTTTAAPPPVGATPGPASPQREDTGFGASENPFASPLSLGAASQVPYEQGVRNGPPWERDGASVNSFIETAKQTYSSTGALFSQMRREGGLGAPIAYAIVAGLIGVFFSFIYQLGFQALLGGLANNGLQGGPGPNLGMFVAPGIITGIVMIVVAPIGIVLGLFIYSGIFHLILMMVGGARFPFETTFRAVAYGTGSASLINIIPICGGYVGWIVQLVFIIIGLARMHETSGGKAAAAVLIPVVFCIGASILFVVMIIGGLAMGAAGAGGR